MRYTNRDQREGLLAHLRRGRRARRHARTAQLAVGAAVCLAYVPWAGFREVPGERRVGSEKERGSGSRALGQGAGRGFRWQSQHNDIGIELPSSAPVVRASATRRWRSARKGCIVLV